MTGDAHFRVSVIVPVYNGTNYLREAIDSVLSQTYKNCELLVVDDGSTDETWTLVQSYGTRLKGVRKENGGVASALNSGIREATGDYIAWLSHDDLFLPDKIGRQIGFMRQFPQFKACYTDYCVIDGDGKVLKEIETPWYPRREAMRSLFGRAYINGSTMLIERECFERVGFFSERLRYTQDTEMWLRILRHFEIGRVPEKLVKWRCHLTQGSQSSEMHRLEAQAMFRKIFEEFGIETLFPEWKDSAHSQETKADAYTWFGDTMAFYRGWYSFADEQYLYSIRAFPSVRNRARVKRMLNRAFAILRPNYRKIRHWVGR